MLCGALGVLALAGPDAATADVSPRHEPAAEACAALGEGGVMETVTAIDDGRGGSLVWLKDGEANLWLCSADAAGQVYAKTLIFEDLLHGAGVKLLPAVTVDRNGKPLLPPNPLGIAQEACGAYLGGAAQIAGSGPDGLTGDWVPGYYVFLETEAGETFLCNATPNARVWAFARIGAPLSGTAAVG